MLTFNIGPKRSHHEWRNVLVTVVLWQSNLGQLLLQPFTGLGHHFEIAADRVEIVQGIAIVLVVVLEYTLANGDVQPLQIGPPLPVLVLATIIAAALATGLAKAIQTYDRVHPFESI